MTSRRPGYGISRSGGGGADKSPSRRRSSRAARRRTSLILAGGAGRCRFDANFRARLREVAPTRERASDARPTRRRCVTGDVIITPRRLRCGSLARAVIPSAARYVKAGDVTTSLRAKVPVRPLPAEHATGRRVDNGRRK